MLEKIWQNGQKKALNVSSLKIPLLDLLLAFSHLSLCLMLVCPTYR